MEHFLKEPIIASVCGPRKSGKSCLTRMLLLNGLAKFYDEIHVLCSSVKLNYDYDDFIKAKYRYKDKFHFYSEFNQKTIEDIFKSAEEAKEAEVAFHRNEELVHNLKINEEGNFGKSKRKKARKKRKIEYLNVVEDPPKRFFTGENTFFSTSPTLPHNNKVPSKKPKTKNILIIMDDVVDSGVLTFHTAIDTLAMRGRHANVSVICNSQRIAPVSVNVRDNSDFLILFCPFSVQEFESAIDKFIPKAYRKKIRAKLEEIFDEEYQFLVINNTKKSIYEKMGSSNAQKFINNEIDYIDLRKYISNNEKQE